MVQRIRDDASPLHHEVMHGQRVQIDIVERQRVAVAEMEYGVGAVLGEMLDEIVEAQEVSAAAMQVDLVAA